MVYCNNIMQNLEKLGYSKFDAQILKYVYSSLKWGTETFESDACKWAAKEFSVKCQYVKSLYISDQKRLGYKNALEVFT